MQRNFRRICVFCGSSERVDPSYKELAFSVGQYLAKQGVGVVYGGGRVGLMGAVARGALEAGGEVIGVIPDRLNTVEIGFEGVTELFVVDSMRARKAMMAHLSDGWLALPGGLGTLEEVFEVATLTQLNFHLKPIGALNHRGYYDLLFAFLAHASQEKFLQPIHRDLILDADNIETLFERMTTVELPVFDIKTALSSKIS